MRSAMSPRRAPKAAEAGAGGPLPLESTPSSAPAAARESSNAVNVLPKNLTPGLLWSFLAGLLISGWIITRSK